MDNKTTTHHSFFAASNFLLQFLFRLFSMLFLLAHADGDDYDDSGQQ